MFAYCVYCQPQRCGQIARLLEVRGADRAISPQVISRHRKQGRMIEDQHDLLPGYVFIYMEQKLKSYELFSGVSGIIRRVENQFGFDGLGYEDYEFAMNLLQKDGTVGAIKAIKEGDTVRVLDPLFERFNGVIVAIDYRKQRAKVRFRFDGQEWEIWVACDVVFKDEATS